ncbi:hypothetical protein TrST_g3798 [Triparma strigata]|uniref:Probable beta-glucosidase G n=1 Tax=Triparma strigata TaxID=1606541 RepID=A0A9W7EB69_9STRA|nr:hypothetical protein TrST_g3798 [Triparma strigata]
MKLLLASALLAAVTADRADDLVSSMTLEEKISYLGGRGMGTYPEDGWYVGTVYALDRLDIPALLYNDGPQGFRDDARPGTTTAFPSGLNIAATWDTEMAALWGDKMGKEFFDKGANVMLGPGLNVARVPVNGRNFEYMSGEDPVLGATLVPHVIEKAQAHKILANAKHWVNNNQETNRGSMSSNVDERTRYEMYYPPFQAAIDAGVGSFMCSYNKINHVYSCENPETLLTDLKGNMGFEGYVMSDWGATHSPSLMEGLDQEMADSDFMNFDNLKDMPIENIDASVKRILKPFIDVGAFDITENEQADRSIYNNVTNDEHFQAARTIAANSHVLLKNDNDVLPLGADFWNSDINVAMFGTQAASPAIGGQGSGRVDAAWTPSPLDTFKARAAGGDYGADSDKVSYYGDPMSDDDIAEMKDAAEAADVCFFWLSTMSGEGGDRDSLSLDNDVHVASVAEHCKKSVVVVTTPGAALLPWSDAVDAILVNFMPGCASAFATMDVVLGDVNPSGKLPITFPATENQEGFTEIQYPGLDDAENVTYTEGWSFGYRFYHQHQENPNFFFGEGLSYTTFDLIKATVSGQSIKVGLKNSGKATGSAVPQLYLQMPEECDEPLWMLKKFAKVSIDAGEETIVEFDLTDRDLSIWDVDNDVFEKCTGDATVRISFSANFNDDGSYIEKELTIV